MSTESSADTSSSGWLLGLGLVALPVVGVCGAGAAYAYAKRRCNCTSTPTPRTAYVKPEHDWSRISNVGSDLGERRVSAVGFPVNLRAASANGEKPVADLRIFEAVETRSCAVVSLHVADAIEKASSPSASADELRTALEPLVHMFGEASLFHFLRSTNVRTQVTHDNESWCFTVHVDDDQHMMAICAHANGDTSYEQNSCCVVYLVFEAAATATDEAGPAADNDEDDVHDASDDEHAVI